MQKPRKQMYYFPNTAFAGTVSACISTKNTRLPSNTGAYATPAGSLSLRRVINSADALLLQVAAAICRTKEKKQDCELSAAKRWLPKHVDELQGLKATILGDDLYSHYPFCKLILGNHLSFIFTCKQSTHPWLAETVQNFLSSFCLPRFLVGFPYLSVF